MQCENCGRPLRPQETICPNCGEPVWPDDAAPPTLGARRAARSGALRVGPPVDPYAPTIYGPQAPARATRDYGDYRGHGGFRDATSPPYAGPGAYPIPRRGRVDERDGFERPLWPAPETPRRARRRGTALIPLLGIVAGLVVVAMLVGGALAASGQLNGLLGLGPGTGEQQPQQGQPQVGSATTPAQPTHVPTATATPTPACPLKTVDKAAAATLKNVQLSSGVKDLQDKDLRPINDLKTFHPGQTLYVTFQFATNQAGTIAADLCTTSNRSDGSQQVPAGFINGRGEFSTPGPLAAPQDMGQGAVILTWNGAVAAALPFQVTNP